MFGGECHKVTLLFDSELLSDIFDRFGDNLRIKHIDYNTLSVDVNVHVSKTFFSWIVGTQGNVKIKSTTRVLLEFTDFVKVIKEKY